jgi:hypothetical protein
MSLKDIFNLRGINFWHIGNSVGWNILWTGASLLLTFYFLEKSPDTAMILQLGLMISIFLGTFLAGLIFGRLAADDRGLTYGLIGSFGSVAICVFLVIPAGGILGLMLAIIALAGGLNGGLFSLRKPTRK